MVSRLTESLSYGEVSTFVTQDGQVILAHCLEQMVHQADPAPRLMEKVVAATLQVREWEVLAESQFHEGMEG